MGMTDINNAAAAQNALTARINAFLDSIDADVATRQAAYDALAGDLVGVVSNQMTFTGTVDPADPAPNSVDGGTFTSFRTLIDAAPSGALVTIQLARGGTFDWDEELSVSNKRLLFKAIGAGADPIINVVAAVESNLNRLKRLICAYGTVVALEDVVVQLPTQKVDAGLGWASSSSGWIICQTGATLAIGTKNVTVNGQENLALTLGNTGNVISLGLWSVTADGAVFILGNATDCIAHIAKQFVTLQNGAALRNGGTIGSNIFES